MIESWGNEVSEDFCLFVVHRQIRKCILSVILWPVTSTMQHRREQQRWTHCFKSRRLKSKESSSLHPAFLPPARQPPLNRLFKSVRLSTPAYWLAPKLLCETTQIIPFQLAALVSVAFQIIPGRNRSQLVWNLARGEWPCMRHSGVHLTFLAFSRRRFSSRLCFQAPVDGVKILSWCTLAHLHGEKGGYFTNHKFGQNSRTLEVSELNGFTSIVK